MSLSTKFLPLAAPFALALAFAAPAQAVVLASSLPAAPMTTPWTSEDNGVLSIGTALGGPDVYDQQLSPSFAVTPGTLQTITWWGYNNKFDTSAGSSDVFKLAIDGVLLNVASFVKTPVGTYTTTEPAFQDIFQYTATLAAGFTLSGSETTLTIFDAGTAPPNWLWNATDNTQGARAFVLEGSTGVTPIPEPGTYALFLAGGLGLLSARRFKRL